MKKITETKMHTVLEQAHADLKKHLWKTDFEPATYM